MGLGRALALRSAPPLPVLSDARPPPVTPSAVIAGPEQPWPPSGVLAAPSETQALSVPAFWRGHAYVCGTVGMLPVSAFRDGDALEPQPPVVVQPDPNQTPMAFWSGVVSSLALYGNAICLVTQRDRYGWPLALKPVHPTLTAVRLQGNPMAPFIAEWYIAGGRYDPSDVWHVKSHLGRAGWPLGRGLVDTEGDAIGSALALQSYGASYFVTGGMPTGILKIHRPEITQTQADNAKAAWVQKFAGSPSIGVLNELTDFTPVSFNPVDSQMIESRQFSLVEVALMWGVPPSKIGANVGGGTYRNAEMEEIQARNDAVAPWVRLLEQSGSIELLPRGQHLQWDMDASLRSDTLSQFQAYQIALGGPGPQSQWLLVDEVRAQRNLDPMSDVADELGVPLPAPLAPAPTEPTPPELPPPVPRQPGGPASSNELPGGT
jgi:HK97 family phage portal protein